eukprot:4872423-Amphidinium_carterae.1
MLKIPRKVPKKGKKHKLRADPGFCADRSRVKDTLPRANGTSLTFEVCEGDIQNANFSTSLGTASLQLGSFLSSKDSLQPSPHEHQTHRKNIITKLGS